MTDIADWTKIPKTLFVVGAKSVDGIGYDVLMCSVPQILKPEVAYVRADTITALRTENERLRAALAACDAHMVKMQAAATRHLTTSRRNDTFIDEMLYLLDGPEQREVESAVRAALEGKQ